MMLPALKRRLNGFELRDHSLLRRNPPDDESSVAVALPTEVGETQQNAAYPFWAFTIMSQRIALRTTESNDACRQSA